MLFLKIKNIFKKLSILSKFILFKLPVLIFVPLLCLLLVVAFLDNNFLHTIPHLSSSIRKHRIEAPNYLVNTPKCKIASVDPFVEEVERLYTHEIYIPCSRQTPLSYITKEGNSVILKINQNLLPKYSLFKIYCCYQKVIAIDEGYQTGHCRPFFRSTEVKDPVVMVKCRNILFQEVYSNIHAVVNVTDKAQKRAKLRFSGLRSRPNVLLVGVDSVSKLNLMRAMPRTYNFLEENDFVSLKGYMKVGSDTLPNLLAMMTGQTPEQVETNCASMTNCSSVWRKYKKMNYLTAYAEDGATIGIFNRHLNPPTDLFFRYYIQAAEDLWSKNSHFCSGPEGQSERIMNLARDFQSLKDHPKLGLFWMKSFSRHSLNLPSAMDERVEEFLAEMLKLVDNTFFFFFSTQGFGRGRITYTQTGWLEERMPFFYIHVPKAFKTNHPKEYKNLMINSGRLSSAFDIYMTLQHLLALADQNFVPEKSLACPTCHSIFKEITEERTCEDAAVADTWCVCNSRSYVSPKTDIVKKAALFVVNKVNDLVEGLLESDRCHYYRFEKITYSAISQDRDRTEGQDVLFLRVKTKPKATFESSLVLFPRGTGLEFRIVGNISRLGGRGHHSKCVKGSPVEEYCFCKNRLVQKMLMI